MIYNDFEYRLYHFISKKFKKLGCPVRIINGMPDHIHCLFFLGRQYSIADVIKQIKGSSSKFINTNKFTPQHFKWQDGYAAFSVSPDDVNRVYNYIKFQKRHHRDLDFENELKRFKN